MMITGGWCAPSEVLYDWAFELRPELWPRGLTSEDLDWLAEMLHAGEIYVGETHHLEIPLLSIQRGGFRWDLP